MTCILVCLLMKVKVESEKVGLKLNIQKTKIMASGPITSWEIDGETVETVSDFIFLYGFKVKLLSHVRLFATPRTVAYRAPPSMGFSRQEYWSGLPCPPLEDLPDPGIKPEIPVSSALQADSLPLSQLGSPN